MDAEGETVGILLARLDLMELSLNLVPAPQLGESAHVELLAGGSTVLAADESDLVGTSLHA